VFLACLLRIIPRRARFASELFTKIIFAFSKTGRKYYVRISAWSDYTGLESPHLGSFGALPNVARRLCSLLETKLLAVDRLLGIQNFHHHIIGDAFVRQMNGPHRVVFRGSY